MNGFSWDDELAPIAGMSYTSGFSCFIGYNNASGSLDYLVPPGATRLTAVAGQLDSSANTTIVIRYEVSDSVSGAVLALHDVPFGSSAQIDLEIDKLIRVTLKTTVLSYGIEPADIEGRAAWADVTFR